MTDPVHSLIHDHAALSRRTIAIGGLVRSVDPEEVHSMVGPLCDLREKLFLHFAREEEGLFPFVAEAVVELAPAVGEMVLAHDAVCGALARTLYLAQSGGDPSSVASLYERFEHTYSAHAQTEAELLERLDALLDADHRARLAAIVEGL